MQEILFSNKLFKRVLLLIVLTVLLIFAVFNIDQLMGILKRAVGIMTPFFLGIVFAFILNLVVKLFEERVFARLNEKNGKIWKKCRRAVCILIAFVLLFAVLGVFCFLVIPELLNSVKGLTDNLPVYANQFTDWINDLLKKYHLTELMADLNISTLKLDWSQLIEKVTSVVSDGGKAIVSLTMGVTTGVINMVTALVFAVYMLASKEKLIRNLKRVIFAFLPREQAKTVVSVGALANRIFSGFVSGQFTEALILGTLCYLGMTILRLPYALLVSVIIAATSLIPIFGAYIGAVLGGVIIIFIDPLSCLWFIIFIICLQNFEGNIIYPRVVGGSIGLPGIWVMLAIFVCGDLFGLIGVLLGVPTFSVLYAILKTVTAKRLEDRNISYEQIVQASKSEVLADTVPVVEEKVETKEKIDQVKKPPKKL
ncbi:AI-2E family transporter [Massiliimalia massiliensis]|uniref:AI-2E family transporter n=1 Tax=Massiliimalia massiliensis TaxID=1852384 RepID=UPI0013565A55|nr:AI-2E family transporter [Massiliimalia massiliensis]